MSFDPAALLSLTGKTALVTGGSRGIGRAITFTLAKAGAFVAINYRSGEEAAKATLEELRSFGGDGMLAPFDVTKSDLVDQGVGNVLEKKGSIEILVNNAGITADGLLGRMKDSDWAEVVQTDLSSAFYLCRCVGKSMIRNRAGRIINIASTAGEAGNAGQTNYSAAKAGLIGFTKALARELATRNILVNAVSPGIISEGLTDKLNEKQMEAIHNHVPVRKMGNPADVAYAVLYLCSQMSEYVTGQVIRINGGLYM